MFKVGDLVRRVKVLSIKNDDYKWVYSDEYADVYGIVVDYEKPVYESNNYNINMNYPECFVKVLWQSQEYSGPLWHWGEELAVIKKLIS